MLYLDVITNITSTVIVDISVVVKLFTILEGHVTKLPHIFILLFGTFFMGIRNLMKITLLDFL